MSLLSFSLLGEQQVARVNSDLWVTKFEKAIIFISPSEENHAS
jgi:hypothetical protein